jgi:dihydroflavonol-4-reductase
MKVFITGATGFIGRRLVKLLLDKKIEITALVRNTGHGLPAGVKTVHGDILEPGSLTGVTESFDRLYHLAALVSFDPGKRAALIRVNAEGTRNALELAVKLKVSSSVVVSSACTFGISKEPLELLNENSIPSNEMINANPYMESKLAQEKSALEFADRLKVVIVNPTTVYGPGDRTLNSGTVIKTVAKAPVMPVTPGGSNVIDVDDVAEAIFLAGEKGSNGKKYIIGSENLSYKAIFDTISRHTGHRPLFVPLGKWTYQPLRIFAGVFQKLTGSRLITPQIVGDMFYYKYFSNELAKKDLGWAPAYKFSESVTRALAYYRTEGLL